MSNINGPAQKTSLFKCFASSSNQSELPLTQEDKDSELNFLKFQKLGSKAYNILRKNAHTIINLLNLMLVSEISQLTDDSLRFLIDRLKLNKTDEEASADFKNEIGESKSVFRRKMDSVVHNLMDEYKKGKYSYGRMKVVQKKKN